jgi:hypothetical protein
MGLEKEDKTNSFGPLNPTSLPPPLVPSASPIQKGPPPFATDPPPQNQNHVEPIDEFLDPELDLELDGMNLDGDAGVRHFTNNENS